MAALSTRLLSAKQSSIARPAWRQAAPTALPSASWRAAVAVADSMPSWSQPASSTRSGARTKRRRIMAARGCPAYIGIVACDLSLRAIRGGGGPRVARVALPQPVSGLQRPRLQPRLDRLAPPARALDFAQGQRALGAGD